MTFMQLELLFLSVWLVVNLCNGIDGLVGHPFSIFALMLPQDVFRKWLRVCQSQLLCTPGRQVFT